MLNELKKLVEFCTKSPENRADSAGGIFCGSAYLQLWDNYWLIPWQSYLKSLYFGTIHRSTT